MFETVSVPVCRVPRHTRISPVFVSVWVSLLLSLLSIFPSPFTSNHHLLPVFSHPIRDSGSFLIRPNLTGTVHKKARLRCAFAAPRLCFPLVPLSFSLSLYSTSTFILRLVSRPYFFSS